MRPFALALLTVLAASSRAYPQDGGRAPAPDTTAEREIRAFREALIGAQRSRDRAALDRMVADGFTFIHSNGATETRDEWLASVAAGMQAAQRAVFETLDERLQVYDGRTAVLVRRAASRVDSTESRIRNVSVYVKTGGRWQWAFGQSTPLPMRPRAAAVDPAAVREVLGRYEIAPGRTFTVLAEGGVLKALTTGRQTSELIPRSATEFAWFNPHIFGDAQVVFIRDAAGRVTHAAYLQAGRELWRARKLD